MAEINWSGVPDKYEGSGTKTEPGMHKLTILDAEMVDAATGAYMLQLTHGVNDNENFKIRFDNYVIIDKEGKFNKESFGMVKLKKLLSAINVTPPESFDPSILPTLVKGKSFKVKLDWTDKGEKFLGIQDIETFQNLNPSADIRPNNDDTTNTTSPYDFNEEI